MCAEPCRHCDCKGGRAAVIINERAASVSFQIPLNVGSTDTGDIKATAGMIYFRIYYVTSPMAARCSVFLFFFMSVDVACSLTHTVLLLYELHQLLQDFIQNPADTRHEAGSAGTSHFLLPSGLSASPRGQQNTGAFGAAYAACARARKHDRAV